jgi:hypothetical protein
MYMYVRVYTCVRVDVRIQRIYVHIWPALGLSFSLSLSLSLSLFVAGPYKLYARCT